MQQPTPLPEPRGADRPALSESLQLSEAVFRAIFDQAGIGIALVNLEGRPIATNPVLQEMLGRSDAELRRMTFAEFTHPEDAEADLALFAELLDGGRDRYQLEKRYLHADGSIVHGRLTVSLAVDAEGNPRYAVGMVEDVTDRVELDRSRRKLQARLFEAQEEERRRIAEDIHDDPIQKMTAVGLRLATLVGSMPAGENAAAVSELQRTIELTISRLRSLMFDLRPPVLDRSGLAAALRDYLSTVTEDGGPGWQLDSDLRVEPPSAVGAVAFRIAQEAIRNAVHHADPGLVTVTLVDDGNGLRVGIADDGHGFDPAGDAAGAPGHLGLVAMRERAELHGGWWRVQTNARGTSITFWLPHGPDAD